MANYQARGMNAIDGNDENPIDDILGRLLNMKLLDVNNRNRLAKFTLEEVRSVCREAEKCFLAESSLLELEAPIKVCGDIHGQYFDLLKLFQFGGLPPKTRYIFLGDFVDRGKNSLEVIMLLFALKAKYPKSFYMIRGNHESSPINRTYGFYSEIRRRFSPKDFVIVFERMNRAFDHVPLAAVIEKKIFCCHGGLSPYLKKLDQIRQSRRPSHIRSGWMTDLVWSDPDEDIQGWEKQNNPLHNPKHRGLGYLFGQKALEEFLDNNRLEKVCRAHECVSTGYRWQFEKQLVTVFSAPNYSRQNAGAIMKIYKSGNIDFQVFGQV